MTQVVILAAGEGTRLRPLTETRPKCMVPLAGRALLERQMETLRRVGLHDIHIVTGYLAAQLDQQGVPTYLNARYATTNMVESLLCARDLFDGRGDVLIAYGDIVYRQQNLVQLIEEKEEIALMVDLNWRDLWEQRFDNPLDDAESLRLDEHGYILEVGKKADSYDAVQGQYTGLIKVRRDKCLEFTRFYDGLDRSKEYDGKDFDNMYMTSFLQLLIDAGWRVKAVPVYGGWLEVDSVEDLAVYEALSERGELQRFFELDDDGKTE